MPPAHRHLAARASALLLSAGLVIGSNACTSDSGSVQAFCDAVAEVPPLASVVTGFAETHPAELSARLDDAESAYEKLRDSAPGEIDDEVEKVVDLVDEVMEAVREHPEDRDAAADGIRNSIADHPEVDEASASLVSYASEHCDIELDPTPDDEVTPDPTTTESTTPLDPGTGETGQN